MSRDKWYDSDDPGRVVRGATIFGIGWMTFVIVVVSILGVAGSVVALEWNSWFSGTKGKLEANIQKNSALNRIEAQAQFHDGYEAVRNLDQKLTDAQTQLDAFNKAHPNVGNGTPFDPLFETQNNLQRNVTGAQQQCHNAVADYNASTEKYLLRDFRDADLPYKMQANDPFFTSGNGNFNDFDCLAKAA